ncbi:lytic transglycosylase domain-containing protein [Chryseosolibacter indicus]|nr:lytic transglycosylase domain-containing protein [Chryseosolibacter indicus]
MKKAFFFSLSIIFSTHAFGQISSDTTVRDLELVIDSLEVAEAEEEMMYKEDTADYVYFYLPTELEYVPGDDHPAVISDRLHCIQKKIPLVYNDKIHAFINYFTVKDREYTKLMMRRKNLYFPLFEKYLAKYNLPDELKYLSIIESGLNPRATSRVRAVGLWQFMSATGKFYGLRHDWYIDERMDPEKATDAACRFLRDLYRMFNDWELALAAYNTGPGNVKRAIRKSGYTNKNPEGGMSQKTFWDIYQHLPRETRSYVPQFVAIIYTMNYLDEHNFYDEGEERLVRHDTLHVNKFLNFETFANLTGTCVEDLQKLNPAIQRNAIPETAKAFTLLVPQTAKEVLAKNRYAILDSASKIGKKEIELLAKASEGSTYGRDRIVYKVKSGDVLGSIAMRHKVTVTDLKKWNNLRSNNIRVGQRLNIWTTQSGRSTVLASTKSSSSKSASTHKVNGKKTYVVQPGDTLWEITRKFEGLTIDKIKSMNKLDNNKIQPGQKLVIGM